jgi:hypothetical protein
MRDCLEDLFKSDSLSLGNAYLTKTKPGYYRVDQPPAHVAAGAFILEDTVDDYSTRQVKDALRDFANPNWTKFESLAGVAPALRLAALSHDSTMHYDTQGRTELDLVFGSAVATKRARELLQKRTEPNLKVRMVRMVHGGTAIDDLDLSKWLARNEIVHVSMDHDNDADFDNFLLVPVQGGVLCHLLYRLEVQRERRRQDNLQAGPRPEVRPLPRAQETDVLP